MYPEQPDAQNNETPNELSSMELDQVSGGIAKQFTGLPFEELIGGPLDAAVGANKRMADTQAEFIKQIGLK